MEEKIAQAHLVSKLGSTNRKSRSKSRKVSANKASADKLMDIRKYYSFKSRESKSLEGGKVNQGVTDNLQLDMGCPGDN